MSSTLTRRTFGAALGGTAAGWLLNPQTARAQGAGEFSIAIIPDPQYLAEPGCTSVSAYARTIQHVIDNRNLQVNGLPLNVKAILGVGDIVHRCTSTSVESAAEAAARQAWNLAFSSGIPAFSPPGNHDFLNSGNPTRATLGYAFRNGFFSQAAIASRFGPNGMLINGSIDTGSYSGAYQEPDPTAIPNTGANTYYRLQIGAYRLLVFCLEFHPRSAVLDWMKTIALANSDHDIIVSTHSYLSDATGQPCTRGTGQPGNKWGPDAYGQGPAPASNCGTEMWAGWFKTIPNLQIVVGGHWIDPATDGGKYWWHTLANNDAGRSVHQMFCNYQQRDINCPTGAATAHVMYLRFLPSWSQMEILVYSVGAAKWVIAGDRTYGATPTVLANPPFSFVSGADSTAPTVPAGVHIANLTASSFNLSWTASSDNVAVTGYRVDVATNSTFTTLVNGYNNKDVGNVVTTLVSGLLPGTTYFARVSGYDAAGNSSGESAAASATTLDTSAPTAPTSLAASGLTSSGFNLAWSASSDNVGVAGYRLDVATDPTFAVKIVGYADKDVGRVTSVLITGLNPSTTYYARVRAYDAARNLSAYSSSISTTTATAADTTAPTAPGNVRTTAIRRLSFDVAWSASTDNVGVTGYLLDVALNSSFATFVSGYRDRSMGLVTSAAVSGLTRETHYYVRVRAIDKAGNRSTYSSPHAVLTKFSGPR